MKFLSGYSYYTVNQLLKQDGTTSENIAHELRQLFPKIATHQDDFVWLNVWFRVRKLRINCKNKEEWERVKEYMLQHDVYRQDGPMIIRGGD